MACNTLEYAYRYFIEIVIVYLLFEKKLTKGLGCIGFQPFAVESLIETSFPLPESIAVGNAYAFAQPVTIILNTLTLWSSKIKASFLNSLNFVSRGISRFLGFNGLYSTSDYICSWRMV